MDMIVCCKQVLDPEAPPATFKVDPATNKVVPPQAVEAALRIKAMAAGARRGQSKAAASATA